MDFSMAIPCCLWMLIVQTSFADSVPRLKCGRSFLPLLMPLERSQHADIFIPRTAPYSGAGCSQSIDMNMGLASDACVATHARSTGVGRLAGRPGPHGRRGLQTAARLMERAVPAPVGRCFRMGWRDNRRRSICKKIMFTPEEWEQARRIHERWARNIPVYRRWGDFAQIGRAHV